MICDAATFVGAFVFGAAVFAELVFAELVFVVEFVFAVELIFAAVGGFGGCVVFAVEMNFVGGLAAVFSLPFAVAFVAELALFVDVEDFTAVVVAVAAVVLPELLAVVFFLSVVADFAAGFCCFVGVGVAFAVFAEDFV